MPGSSAPEPDWTGERLVPGAGRDAIAEHLHRYAFARDFAAGRDVLDIACGEGYGSALLAAQARSVLGVDLDPAAVAHATAKYRRGNLRFVAGSVLAIPLEAATVDLAVSFETLEHLAEHDEMLAELRRVLRPEGLLIISTPERGEYSEAAHYRNPFHVRELNPAEFAGLLQSYFAHVRVLGQRLAFGSAMVEPGQSAGWRRYAGTLEAVEASEGLPAPRYLVAVCSAVALAPCAASLFEDAVEREALSAGVAYRVSSGAERRGWRRFWPSAQREKLELEPVLACKVRSFTVTVRGVVPAGVTAMRVRVREKVFAAVLEAGGKFVAEVNVGSGRHPATIEGAGADGAWRDLGAVRVEAPEAVFRAERREG